METENEKKKFSLKRSLTPDMKMIPLKILILSFSGGAVCLFAFVVLQLKLLGLTINDIALLTLILPIASLLGPIISGMIADKLGKYNYVLIGSIILMSVFHNCLLLMPYPEQQPTVSVTCHNDSINVVFDKCGDSCFSDFLSQEEFHGALVLRNCTPCSAENNGQQMECPEDLESTTALCPNFQNISDQISINFTTTIFTTTNVSCELNITEERSNWNVSSISMETERRLCSRTNCHFKCPFPEDLRECRKASSPPGSNNFLLAGIAMFFAALVTSSAFTIMDAFVLQFVKKYGISLGKQKIMTVLGFGITPVIAGALIDLHSKRIGTTSFFPAFMLSNCLMGVAAITACFITIKIEENKSNIVKDLGKLVIRPEVDLFLLVALILGCNFGFIESYLFIYLQSLGASNFLLGLTMAVGCLSSIPMLYFADATERLIGRHFIFLVCFTAYSIRMFGYSFIKDPWMSLIFETLEAITYQLMWVTCLKLCPLLAPKGLLATMTGLTGAVHYCCGRGIGGFLGGRLIDLVGLQNAFRVFGGIALFGGAFYMVLHYAYLKKKIEEREREIGEENELKTAEESEAIHTTNKLTKRLSLEATNTEMEPFMGFAGSRNKLTLDVLTDNRNSKEITNSVPNGNMVGVTNRKERSTSLKNDFYNSSVRRNTLEKIYNSMLSRSVEEFGT